MGARPAVVELHPDHRHRGAAGALRPRAPVTLNRLGYDAGVNRSGAARRRAGVARSKPTADATSLGKWDRTCCSDRRRTRHGRRRHEGADWGTQPTSRASSRTRWIKYYVLTADLTLGGN